MQRYFLLHHKIKPITIIMVILLTIISVSYDATVNILYPFIVYNSTSI